MAEGATSQFGSLLKEATVRRMLVGFIVTALVAVVAASSSPAAPSASGPFPLKLSFKLMPAAKGAKIRTVNVYLKNTSGKMSGAFFFAVTHEGAVRFTPPKGYKSWREGPSQKLLGNKPGLRPGQSILIKVTLLAKAINDGTCVAGNAWLRYTTDTRQALKQECWNIG